MPFCKQTAETFENSEPIFPVNHILRNINQCNFHATVW